MLFIDHALAIFIDDDHAVAGWLPDALGNTGQIERMLHHHLHPPSIVEVAELRIDGLRHRDEIAFAGGNRACPVDRCRLEIAHHLLVMRKATSREDHRLARPKPYDPLIRRDQFHADDFAVSIAQYRLRAVLEEKHDLALIQPGLELPHQFDAQAITAIGLLRHNLTAKRNLILWPLIIVRQLQDLRSLERVDAFHELESLGRIIVKCLHQPIFRLRYAREGRSAAIEVRPGAAGHVAQGVITVVHLALGAQEAVVGNPHAAFRLGRCSAIGGAFLHHDHRRALVHGRDGCRQRGRPRPDNQYVGLLRPFESLSRRARHGRARSKAQPSADRSTGSRREELPTR